MSQPSQKSLLLRLGFPVSQRGKVKYLGLGRESNRLDRIPRPDADRIKIQDCAAQHFRLSPMRCRKGDRLLGHQVVRRAGNAGLSFLLGRE